jgi:hypothetical protein
MLKINRATIGLFLFLNLLSAPAWAQEKIPTPYFIAYDHYMEEPDTLGIDTMAVQGHAHDVNTFIGGITEFEYAPQRWWTTELYLDWQRTQHEGSLFTGFRLENRFRPLLEEHRINPVLYVEYAHITAADKALKEIVGFDSRKDLQVPNSVARHDQLHELETRLILSSEVGQWNVTGNFIGEKNLTGHPWEFGYAAGVSRPLAAATGKRCTFCAEKFSAGIELYGGLGEWGRFTLNGTSQYIAPTLLWVLPSETAIRFSPGWGLTDNSLRILFRAGVTQDIDNIGQRIGRLFHRH